jgi:hypothetical protein
MNIDNKLDELKNIKHVEAPPFLLTRIKQQIRNLENAPAPVKWRWAFAVSAAVIIALNLSVFFSSNIASKSDGIETVINSMQLTNTNPLYNE